MDEWDRLDWEIFKNEWKYGLLFFFLIGVPYLLALYLVL